MKKSILIILILFPGISIFSQVAILKNEIAELFFEIPINSSKFQVRKALNQSNIIRDIEERDIPNSNYSIISAYFSNNYKLGNLNGIEKMYVTFYFSKEGSIPYYRTLTFEHENSTFNKENHNKLLKELLKLFKSNYKMIEKPFLDYDSKLIGEKYLFYLSTIDFNLDKSFLKIDSFVNENHLVISLGVEELNIN
jgi:hypothetical protein